MAKLLERTATPLGDDDAAVQNKVDVWLIGGAALCGTIVLGFLGLPLVFYGLILTRRAMREGRSIRPIAVTLIGLTAFADSAINVIIWPMDWVAHDTVLAQTLFSGLGRLWDSGYYLSLNTTSMGGHPLSAEKGWEIASILTFYPMRLVASWGFLRMKRWGFQFLVVSSYMYAMFWIGYVVQMAMDFPFRFGYSAWGVIGWWVMNLPYATAFLVIPYLHNVNRELWTE